MTDVAQILGVGNPSDNNNHSAAADGAAKNNPPAHHQPSRAMMKMQSVSREVLDLLSGKKQDRRTAELPPAVPTRVVGQVGDGKSVVKVGSKWISTQKPARPWTWASFTSSSRTDGLALNHWVRANVEYPDYPYARFDIHLDPVVYSDDEYQAYLTSDDWTRSETDLLMELARRYELRWSVIHDRWLEAFYDGSIGTGEAAGGASKQEEWSRRRVEDLQHRYYSVAALLTQSRISQEAAVEVKLLESAPPNPNETDPRRASDQRLLETAAARALAASDPQHQPLIHNLGSGSSNKVFDLNRERERRSQMEALWNRTKQEELEEIELRKELKQIEVQLRKLKKRGAHILAAKADGSPQANLLGAGSASSRNPSRSVTPVAGAPAAVAPVEAANLDHAFASTAPTPMPQYPYLQSGRLAPPATGGAVGLNKTLLTRMETILSEMNVPARPLPTKRVCDLYDSVRKDTLTLLILQKNALQREGLVQSRRLKLAKMGGNVRVVDEETLMGIAPPPRPTTTTTATKTQRGSKTKAVGSAKSKAASRKDGSGMTISNTSGEKKARKSSVKRKRKPESTKAPAVGAVAAVSGKTAPSAAGGKPMSTRVTSTGSKVASKLAVSGKGADSGEPRPTAKKRARKS